MGGEDRVLHRLTGPRFGDTRTDRGHHRFETSGVGTRKRGRKRRDPARVGEEVEERDRPLSVDRKFGKEVRHRLMELQQAPLHKGQDRGDGELFARGKGDKDIVFLQPAPRLPVGIALHREEREATPPSNGQRGAVVNLAIEIAFDRLLDKREAASVKSKFLGARELECHPGLLLVVSSV